MPNRSTSAAVSNSVAPDQRFTHGRTCPICKGDQDERRGAGERCFGYLADNGEWTFCTREEFAGRAVLRSGSNAYPHQLKGKCPCGTEHAPADPKPKRGKAGQGTIVQTYPYHDADGTFLMETVRLEPKDFRQRRPIAGGTWAWDLKGVPIVPYRLPELLAADPEQTVFIVEGEKDVDALRNLGAVATCNHGGAGKWRSEHARYLKDRDVVILADNDKAGRDHAESVAKSLQGIARSVRIVLLPGLPEKGDVSDFIASGGTREDIAKAALKADVWADPDTRPEIEVNAEVARVLAETLAILRCDTDLYCRGDLLVRIAHETSETAKLPGGVEIRKAKGTPRVIMMAEAGLTCRLSALADFYSWFLDKNKEPAPRPVKPPSLIVRALLENGHYPGVRSLRSVAEVPFPRADGSLVTEPGYDPATGVFYSPSVEIEPIPDKPTKEDAKAAAQRLLKLIKQFPFPSDDDKAVWLAALLTAMARPGIDGCVPGFAFVGNRAGTGKGKLIDSIGVIATGRPVPTTTYPEDRDEMRKVKTAFALDATPIIHLDNMEEGHSYGGGVLDSALTSLTVTDRILGVSKTTLGIELRAVWIVSGNGITPKKDAYRRWLVCNLQTALECPEERDDLEISDLLAHVREHRAALVRAALVILRAHAVAGRPTNGWAPLGSFEEWDRVVRGAVWFATEWDCNATRRKAADNAPERLDRLSLLEAWDSLPGGSWGEKGITAAQAYDMACHTEGVADKKPVYPKLVNALMQFSRDGRIPSSRIIGNQIRAMDLRNIGGLKFKKAGEDGHVALWVVLKEDKKGSGDLKGSDSNHNAENLPTDSYVMAHASNGNANGNGRTPDPARSLDPATADFDWTRF